MELLFRKWSFNFMLVFGAVILTAFFIVILFTSLPEKTLDYFFSKTFGINPNNFMASLLLQEDKEGEEEPAFAESYGEAKPAFGPNGYPALEDKQNLIDDLKERIDILKQQLLELQEQEKQKDEEILEEEELEEEFEEVISCVGQININTASLNELDKITGVGPQTAQKIINARPFYSLDDLLKVSGVGETTLQKIKEQNCAFVDSSIGPAPVASGGGGVVAYPKILISEIQVYPTNQRFIELYNPNSANVDLTGWYLQRKDSNDDSWGSLVSKTYFAGQTIGSNDYFLISREETSTSDISLAFTLSNDNSLAFKNPAGEITDQTSFGVVEDDKSVGRIDLGEFEINKPTPKAQNKKWEAIPVPKNILINEVQVAGVTTKDEFIELYNPNNFDINLEGFSLKKKTASGSESSLVSSSKFFGTITALGYFLIVPQDNIDGTKNYTGLPSPDLFYSGKTYSISSDNTVLLYNEEGLQDKVGFGVVLDFEGNNPSLNPPKGQSIARTNGVDTNDNLADFIVTNPTPKS